MQRIARDVEQLMARCQDLQHGAAAQDHWADVLVIGSGYGGAVAAQRFAEAGRAVWLLERGAQYLAGDFPRDIGHAPEHVRAERVQGGQVQALGYEAALFDFRFGAGASALVGNGLGGGSLINAAVAMQPDARVFAQPEWPQALREPGALKAYYQRARQGLEVQSGAQQRRSPDCVPQHSLKYARLAELAEASRRAPADSELKVRFEDVDLAIEFGAHATQQWGPRQACTGCGNCVSGCNFNAKLSLDRSYLARAHQAGAALYTGVTALWLAHQPDARHPGHPWLVHCVRTGERATWEQLAPAEASAYVFTVRAAQLVLAGGTFGSSELLLRSQRLGGLDLASAALGQGISANGDDLSAAYDLPRAVQGYGHEDPPVAGAPTVGPTISGVVHFDHPRDVRLSTLTEDGAIPGLLRPLVSQALALLGTLPQLTRWGRRHPQTADDLSLQPSNVHNTLVMLGMGHDRAGGSASLDRAVSRLRWAWRDSLNLPASQQDERGAPGAAQCPPGARTAPEPPEALTLHRQRLQIIERLGGQFLPNPALGILPDALKKILGKSDVQLGWITVHPLGGCRMGDSPAQGVVNHRCQVFRRDGSVHAGLYVMDGSVIPRSLGVNPLLTITAVAERACALALAAQDGVPRQETDHDPNSDRFRVPGEPPEPAAAHRAPGLASTAEVEAQRPMCTDSHIAAQPSRPWQAAGSAAPVDQAPAGAAPTPPEATACGTSLNEVLRGRLHWAGASPDLPAPLQAALAGGAGELPAALFLEMAIDDWPTLWADPLHVAAVAPGGQAVLRDDSHFTRSRLVIDLSPEQSLSWPVTAGTVQIFRPMRSNFCQRLGRLPATAATYVIGRWWPDFKRPRPKQSMWHFFIEGLRMCWRATDARGFSYRLHIDAGGQTLELRGTKFIQPAASGTELWQWLVQKWQAGGWPVLVRRSVWAQLTQLDVTLHAPASTRPLAQGRLSMDLPEMVRRVAPQLQPGPDIVLAMTALLSYPTVILRYLLSNRLLDFRLPDYREGLPKTDWAVDPKNQGFELRQADYPALTLRSGRRVPPEAPVPLQVARHAGAAASDALINVGLVRYRQPVVSSQHLQGMRRYRSIVLMNGFAQNTLPFVAPELGSDNLATQLYEAGWDVWLFEYRVSPFLRASALASSMDDIAAADIPAAVNHVLHAVAGEQGQDPAQGQIFFFSHCVGSASLGMSLLGGQLRHAAQTGQAGRGASQLAGVLLSQFQPFVIGSYTAQMRLQLATALVHALGLDYIQFSAGTVQADAFHALLDRLFASFDVDPHEHCPHEKDLRQLQPDSTTCKRMAGLLSRLFVHDQLLLSTHEQLDRYFGRTNLGVFTHGAQCVAQERLVNAQGQNVYLTSENIRQYLDMPLMLIHGEKNVLFDREGLDESQRQLSRHFGQARLASGQDCFLAIPGMAHFDCTIGRDAPQRVFAPVLQFFDRAWRLPHTPSSQVPRLRARLPRTGPQIGWTRQEGDEICMRVWLEVDQDQSDQALCAMTVLCVGGRRIVQCWPLRQDLLRTGLQARASATAPAPGDGTDATGAREQALRYALADLRWPASAPGTVSVAMLSLHHYSTGEEAPVPPEHPSWGAPLALHELQHARGRTPSSVRHRSPGAAQSSTARVVLDLPPAAAASARPGTAGEGALLPQALPSGAQWPGRRAAPDRWLHDSAQDPAQEPVQDEVPGTIAPLDWALSLDDARALLRPLLALLAQARDQALKADPGCLSRLRRSVRSLTPALLRVREASWKPQGARLRLLLATCRHPGLSTLELWRRDTQLLALAQRQQQHPAAFMWMLGDQIYADATAGMADSQLPIERFLPQYRDAFGSSGFRALARQLPLYMVMDDHEISDNWSRDLLRTGRHQTLLFDNAWASYRVFQQAHGPASLAGASCDAVLDWAGLSFYRLNTRLYRDRLAGHTLSTEQWAALEHWLLAQQARGAQPKFILSGSVLAPGLAPGLSNPDARTGDTWQAFGADRQRLLHFIAAQGIQNVVFVSGDYHCSAQAVLHFPDPAQKAYALVSPPLHAPAPFANVAPAEVLQHESVDLPEGAGVVHIEAQAYAGEGWLECACEPQPSGRWQLQAAFHVTPLGQTQARVHPVSWMM